MSDFTDYTEGHILNWISQDIDMPSSPSSLFIALHTADPGETPDGSTEVSAGDYARYEESNWDISGGSFENAGAIVIGTASNDWGVITHMSLWDGPTTGDNAIAAFPMTEERVINTDDPVTFDAGDISFTVD